MSSRGGTEHVTLLRAAIDRIERGGSRPPVRRDEGCAAIALGPDGLGLDRLLGGGLRRGALHEIAPAAATDEGAAARFAVAVAVRALATHPAVVWIVDGCAVSESGAPYRPGLEGNGLDPDRLVVVRTRSAAETLWAAEEALRAGDALVLAELWAGRGYGLAPSRRLVLAAQHRGGTALLLHAGRGGAEPMSTGCDTRLVVAARPSRHLPAATGPVPVPGPPAFAVRIAKARSAAAAIDPLQVFVLAWAPIQRCFHDPDHPVAVAAAPADRPAAPQRRSARRRP